MTAVTLQAAVKLWFEQRNPRERQMLVLDALVCALALLWWVAIAPALQSYRQSDAAHAKLDAQMADMQAMAAESKRLKAAPHASSTQAQTWLEGATKKLTKASLTVQGSRAQVSFNGVPADVLANWVAEARTAVQLLPVQANWKKGAATGPEVGVTWDGILVFELPK